MPTPTARELERDGRALLFSFMTDEQIDCYTKYRYFFVISRKRHVFVLSNGWYVTQMHEGRAETEFHVGSCYWEVDKYHSLLTQMLFLQSKSEDYLLGTGCRNGPHWDYTVGCPPMKGYKAIKP